MDSPWRQACLLVSLVGLPVGFAMLCVRFARGKPGRLLAYLAYYLLFGCAGQWLLAASLAPSNISQVLRAALLTAAPVACFSLALVLQRMAQRTPFETGALAGCYLYTGLVAVLYAMRF